MTRQGLSNAATSIALALSLGACTPSDERSGPNTPVQDLSPQASCANPDLKLTQVQSIGSHNSYKQAIPFLELQALRRASPEAAYGLDYAHRPLGEQLDLGMRQLELDIFHDPDGGRYATPYLPNAIPSLGKRYDVEQMDAPGFKVMHVQDVDQRSHCPLFVDCLADILAWSDAHQGHTPILILINAKQDPIDLDQSVTPLPFTKAAFDALDADIRSAFPDAKLITPDKVRGNAATLAGAVRQQGWPNYEDSRGKFIFVLDEAPDVVEVYMRGRASLEGLPVFINAISLEADHAAYVTLNDPIKDAEQIQNALTNGLLVRTRADADTVEARTNDTRRRDAAFASGAQYISTDYYQQRKKFSDYVVKLPHAAITRCSQ